MLFAYNTSYHPSTKCTPYFLTYGHEARYPSNPNPDIQYYYGDSLPAQWFSRLQEARDMAVHNSVQASEKVGIILTPTLFQLNIQLVN